MKNFFFIFSVALLIVLLQGCNSSASSTAEVVEEKEVAQVAAADTVEVTVASTEAAPEVEVADAAETEELVTCIVYNAQCSIVKMMVYKNFDDYGGPSKIHPHFSKFQEEDFLYEMSIQDIRHYERKIEEAVGHNSPVRFKNFQEEKKFLIIFRKGLDIFIELKKQEELAQKN